MAGWNDKVSVISLPGLVSSTFTWETVNSFNVGFDVSAFNNRLQVVFDWFKRKTTGMLSEGIEIPSVVGAGALCKILQTYQVKDGKLIFHGETESEISRIISALIFMIAEPLLISSIMSQVLWIVIM